MTRVEENKEQIENLLKNEEQLLSNPFAGTFEPAMVLKTTLIASLLIDISKSLAIQADAAVEANKLKKYIDGVPPLIIPDEQKPRWIPKQTDATDIDDGSIKVGDEVRIKGSDPVKDDCDYGICTRSLPNVNTIYVMRRDGSSGEENKDEWYRTGRFFPQIAEVLKQLRGEI